MHFRMSAATAAAVVALAAALPSVAAAAASAPSASCVGLACAGPDNPYSVPEAYGTQPRVATPSALKQQRRAGFYEFTTPELMPQAAVAYVSPPGQLDAAPGSIRKLPVVQDMRASDFDTGTVVIFDEGTALYSPSSTAPQNTEAAAAASKTPSSSGKRPVARAADVDMFGCSDTYFCLYEDINWYDTRVQFHNMGYWQNLGDYLFNDQADSVRNRRDRDSWLAEHINGGGDRHCFDSHTAVASLNSFGSWIGFGDDASSTYNSYDDNRC